MAAPRTNGEKLDYIIAQMATLAANFEAVQSDVKEHDIILRGPDRTDGLIEQVQDNKRNIGVITDIVQEIKKASREMTDKIWQISIGLGIPLTLAILAFIWALVSNKITLTF